MLDFFFFLSLLMNTTFDRFGTRHTIKGRKLGEG